MSELINCLLPCLQAELNKYDATSDNRWQHNPKGMQSLLPGRLPMKTVSREISEAKRQAVLLKNLLRYPILKEILILHPIAKI